QGKVLYVGVSDAPAWWVSQANTLASLRGWTPFVGLQIEYSLVERTVERELIPMARALNLGVVAWSPLSNGVLTGKYHGHGASEPGRLSGDMLKDFMPEEKRTGRIVAAVKAVSDQAGRSMAQVSLAWLRSRPAPVIPIIGARKLSQLEDNLASIDLSLSADQLKALEEASRIELGFPHELYVKELTRAFIHGGMCARIIANNFLTGGKNYERSQSPIRRKRIHRQANSRYGRQQGNRGGHCESLATRRRRRARRRKKHTRGRRHPTVHSSGRQRARRNRPHHQDDLR